MEKQGEGSEIKSMHVADIMFLHVLVFLSKEITSNEKGRKYVPLKPQKTYFSQFPFPAKDSQISYHQPFLFLFSIDI